MRRGWGQVYQGNPEEGLVAFERAMRLSPLDPFAFNVHLGMGLAHFAGGRPQLAIRFAKQAMSERPGLTWPYRDLAAYYADHGDLASARDSLLRFTKEHRDITVETIGDSLRFMEPALLSKYLRGLKLAGLESAEA